MTLRHEGRGDVRRGNGGTSARALRAQHGRDRGARGRCVQAEVSMGGKRHRPIDACVPAIARFCDCKVWLTRGARPKSDYDADFDWTQPGGRYVFFGFETDTVLATYLFAVIDRATTTEAATFKQANPALRGVDCAGLR